MADKAKGILDRWLSAVNGGDLEGVLALYAPHAVLVPTFSERLRDDPEEIRDYFVQVSSRDDLSVELDEESLLVQDLGNGLFSLAGLYDWRHKADGLAFFFRARFTYTVDTNSKHPILHHHSSELPRG